VGTERQREEAQKFASLLFLSLGGEK